MQVPPLHPDPLLTEQQAAEVLGVKPGTLQVWRCTRRYGLPFVKVGRLVRYPITTYRVLAVRPSTSAAPIASPASI